MRKTCDYGPYAMEAVNAATLLHQRFIPICHTIYCVSSDFPHNIFQNHSPPGNSIGFATKNTIADGNCPYLLETQAVGSRRPDERHPLHMEKAP
jgi:hypothetical protein